VRQGCRTLPEGQEVPSGLYPSGATPVKTEERRKQAAFGAPFLWFLSFGEAKERNSPAGARTGFKIIVAVATQC